jgi:hypothetical protein
VSVVKVTLAEAPTDILVYLASLPTEHWRTSSGVVAACAPDDLTTAEKLTAARGALSTLVNCGYVEQSVIDGWVMYRSTDEGRAAVAAATS